MDQFSKINEIQFKSVLWRFALQATLYGISNSFIFFMQPAAYAFGYYQIHDGLLTTADMFRIFAMLIFSTMLLGRLYSMMPDQKGGLKATKEVFRIIDRESKIDSLSELGLRPDNFTGRIKFENVYFRYPNRPEVKILNGLTVDMNENKTTALVGPSGKKHITRIVNKINSLFNHVFLLI
jgi:ATP-binding cassette subfamily B (MDR/TAP) protein 1